MVAAVAAEVGGGVLEVGVFLGFLSLADEE